MMISFSTWRRSIAVIGAIVGASCAPATQQTNRPFVPGDPRLDMVLTIPAAPPRDSSRIPTTWAEELQGMSGVHIFARNDRSRPVRVTKVSISTCQNVKGGCIEWDPDLVLQPGEKRRIYTILPELPTQAYRYQWRASGREERVEIAAPTAPTAPTDTEGWLIVGTDSASLTLMGLCTYVPAPAAPSGRTGSCDSVPQATYRLQLEQRRLVIAPGGEFRIRYGTKPGAVEIMPAPAAMIGATAEYRYRAPREPGVYRYTIDAGWGRQAASRSLFELVVR